MNLFTTYKVKTKIYTDSRYFIYRAVHKADSSLVAIKIINPQSAFVNAKKWLNNEYKILKDVNSPGIIKPISLEKYDNKWALILNDFKDEFLARFIEEQTISLDNFFKIAIQLVEIIRQIHINRIIHNNINPASIVINRQTLEVKITDFSIATNSTQNHEITSYDLEELNVAYISPEQTGRINQIPDYRTDFYSLGIVFYRMLTGILPYDSQDSLELVHCHLAQTPVSPHQIDSKIPLTVSSIVMKLLAKNPEDRYQSAYGIKANLATCQTQYRNTGKIPQFELGIVDKQSQFTVSTQLYGRTSAIDTLTSSLKRVYSGATEVVLISGELGSGKTTLVKKVVKPIVQQKGFLITGKFELSKGNIPYTGITQAFSNLIQQLLREDADSLQIWRTKILSALGDKGRIITDILPELKLIIGFQPDVPKLPAKETENRFNTIFIEFVKVFIKEKHPLVLFLDDLQWADSASLNLLGLLLDNLNERYLLIIWAYQKNQSDYASSNNLVFSDFVNFASLLSHTIKKIRSSVPISSIVLQPLDINNINRLLVDTLHCQKKESLSLAKLVFERTQGNPFFIHQFLNALYEEKLLTFDFYRFIWQWDTERIRSTSINNYSALELTAQNISKLEPKSQKLLKIAACFGDRFDIGILEIVCKRNRHDISKILKPGVRLGIIFVATKQPNKIYQFVDKRIQQKVYSLLEETEKVRIHLQIGCLLLKSTPKHKVEDKIFDLVNHLNIGRELIPEGKLKHYLAELNFIAAKKAQYAIAYEVAADHLQIALELLPSSAWKDNYDLILNIYLKVIEVQYLKTDFQTAEHLANIALSLTKKPLEKIKIYVIKIHAYIARNRIQFALETGLQALKIIDISLTNDLTYIDCEKLKAYFEQKENQTLQLSEADLIQSLKNLPKITNCLYIAALEILVIIIPASYVVKPQLFPVIVSKMIELCLQHGNSRFSAFAYGCYGLLLCTSGNINLGYQFGKLALIIQEQFDAREMRAKVSFLFNNMIRHWREPVADTISYFLEGIQEGIEIGDVEYACFLAKYYCTYLFFTGKPLSFVIESSQERIDIIQNFKQEFQLNYALIWQQLSLNLQGLSKNQWLLIGESFNESERFLAWQKTNDATSLFAFHLAKLILCYLLEDYPQAVENARKGKQYLKAAAGTMCFSMYYFYASLAQLAVCSSQVSIDSEPLQEIVAYQKQIEYWANNAPDNYLNKYHLVTAEIARVLGKHEQAAQHYDLAITTAAEVGYIHEAALAEELTGKFYLSQGRTKIARYYLTDAYYGYSRWDASAKAQALSAKYSQLLNRIPEREPITTDTHQKKAHIQSQNPVTLDLFSVLKASQAISSEIILDNLLSKMTEIVMENAGAQKTVLFLQQNTSWVVAASANIIPKKIVELPCISIAEYSKFPKLIINYIQSTRSTVILEEATKEGIFTEDPYIVQYRPKSILACPIIYKHELQGIIYLENNLVKGAFKPQQLEILQVLLSQVSISIENARLYNDLKNHASVQKSLRQKEILLKEIHHRVKNNLLVVSGILDFQSSYIDDPEVIKLLNNCQNRITSMALVHQHLYGDSKLNTINFAQYIESLLNNLAYSQASKERNINIVCDLDNVELNIETANPCGLIINELVSNALEHGFVNCDCGNIWLSLKQNLEGQILLTVRDDGVGFKEDIDLFNSDSLGLELVCTFVEQIDGTIKLDKTNGTKIEIAFKELHYTKRV